MKKSCSFLAGVIFISLLFSACGMLSDNLSKKEIFKLVKKNEATLLQCIAEDNYENTSTIKGIVKISVDEEIVDFYCGGAGFGSATSYYGFYYSADENMTAIWCAGFPIMPDGDGYSWNEENGDNRYYTEKICDCFYYYEAHF